MKIPKKPKRIPNATLVMREDVRIGKYCVNIFVHYQATILTDEDGYAIGVKKY